MSNMPAVLVKKGGFLSALFTGFFGLLITVVICASGLGVYTLHLADKIANGLFGVSGTVIASIPEWQSNLPPLLAESLNDRRAPDYRKQVDISTKLVGTSKSKDDCATLVTVTNHGSETVTMLALIITLEDRDGVPVSEKRAYAATPITIDEDDWRGPLLPSETRKFVVRYCRRSLDMNLEDYEAHASVSDIRVWNDDSEGDAEEAVELTKTVER